MELFLDSNISFVVQTLLCCCRARNPEKNLLQIEHFPDRQVLTAIDIFYASGHLQNNFLIHIQFNVNIKNRYSNDRPHGLE